MSGATLAVIGEGLIELEFEPDGRRLRCAPGGDAGNVAAMAARLGARVRIGGRVGADPFGERLLAFWHACGVDVAHVRTDPVASTGLYLNTAATDGHQFTYWRRASAGSRLDARDLAAGFFDELGILAFTGLTLAVSPSSAAAVADAVLRAQRVGARVACVLNHRPALGDNRAALAAVARAADIVIGSTEDAAAVFNDDDPVRLAAGPLRVPELVLTAGDEPVRAVVDGSVSEQPVPAVPVQNAAGAGDAFAGAYLARRLAGNVPATAMAWGAAAAARSVTRSGCAGSYPTFGETAALADELLVAA